ncbi:hypothetical protein, partial [Enterovirga sp. CN4-39]|uniref:hypothetical protein n=1 Tax=Enterovirga sp. CN4-39 TaxID=3400910 RepID=UPI003BFF9D6A
ARREAARAAASARRAAAREARLARRRVRGPYLEAYNPNYRYDPPYEARRSRRAYGEWVYPEGPVRSYSYVERRRYYSDGAGGYYVRRAPNGGGAIGGIIGWLGGDD